MNGDVSWVRVLEHHASRTPDKPFVSFAGATITYGEMVRRVAALAAGLAARGIGPGDVVALLSFNNVEFLTTLLAASYVGAIGMPLNWRLAAPELAYILEHSGARLLVSDDALLSLANEAVGGRRDLVRVAIFTELVGSAAVAPRTSASGDDVQRLMYTSGTTGRPKGVMITNANLAWKSCAHVAELGLTTADIGLACGPLYHVGALDLVTTSMLAVGATTIVHRSFDATAVVAEIERSRVTVVWMAPSMIRAVLDLPGIEHRDLSSVRVLIGGGEKMPIPFIQRLKRTFPTTWFADAYGLTETVSGDTFLDRASLLTKRGSVGRACLYLDLAIWDENGSPLAAGERGEVVLRGPKVFKGYWRDDDATSKAFAGGWFHTGDIGMQDADGYVYILDRLKDMIVSGGENIASSEVERVLYEHDAVLETAVVGRPDERWGEVPVAFVVLKPDRTATSEELVAHCRERLARFKVPKAMLFVRALPRNPSGKVLKRSLRDQVAESE